MAPTDKDQRHTEKACKFSFKRRSKLLRKKAEELSFLCDADLCVIIFPPAGDLTAMTWPKDPSNVERVLLRYLALYPSQKIAEQYTTIKDSAPAAAPGAQAEAGPSSPKKRAEKMAGQRYFKPAGEAAELPAGAEAGPSCSASKKGKEVEDFALRFPGLDEMNELSSLMEVLNVKEKEVFEEIAELSLSTPAAAMEAEETPESKGTA